MAAVAKVQQAGAAASIGHSAGSKKRKYETVTANRNRTGVLKNGAVFLPGRLALNYGSKMGMFLLLESFRRGRSQLI